MKRFQEDTRPATAQPDQPEITTIPTSGISAQPVEFRCLFTQQSRSRLAARAEDVLFPLLRRPGDAINSFSRRFTKPGTSPTARELQLTCHRNELTARKELHMPDVQASVDLIAYVEFMHLHLLHYDLPRPWGSDGGSCVGVECAGGAVE